MVGEMITSSFLERKAKCLDGMTARIKVLACAK